MTVRVIEAKEDKVTTADLIEELKKSSKVDYSGAIFTFEGIVRGKEENMNLEKLILTTPDRDKTQAEIEKIVENAKSLGWTTDDNYGSTLFQCCDGPHFSILFKKLVK